MVSIMVNTCTNQILNARRGSLIIQTIVDHFHSDATVFKLTVLEFGDTIVISEISKSTFIKR